jgi:phage baseplate assembly protein W
MDGMSATTGKTLGGIDHLRQSIRDILTTRIGTRIMRRTYGSRLFELIDAPLNSKTITDIYAAVAEAIAAWEPRFKLTKAQIVSSSLGSVTLDLTGDYLPDGISGVQFNGIVIN